MMGLRGDNVLNLMVQAGQQEELYLLLVIVKEVQEYKLLEFRLEEKVLEER